MYMHHEARDTLLISDCARLAVPGADSAMRDHNRATGHGASAGLGSTRTCTTGLGSGTTASCIVQRAPSYLLSVSSPLRANPDLRSHDVRTIRDARHDRWPARALTFGGGHARHEGVP